MRLLAAALTLAFGVVGMGLAQQPPVVLDKSEQLRELLRTVAKYPPEVRQAIPVVAQHAKLPNQLLDAIGDKKPGEIDEILAKYPKDVQTAAKQLVAYPEILEVLMSQRAITELIGKAYAELGPEKLKALAAEMRADDDQTRGATVAAWVKRLKGNPAALQQLVEATRAYLDAADASGGQDYGLGCAVTDRNQAVVYALPAAPLTTFVLVNADQYPQLADEMMEQWLRTDGNDDFDMVMASYWNAVRQYATPKIFEPAGRPERLKAIASLVKLLGEKFPDERPKFEERVKFLNEQIGKFPELKPYLVASPMEIPPLKPGEKLAKPSVPAKPAPLVATNAPPKSPGSDTPPPKKDTTASTKKTAPAPTEVTAVTPTQEQQVRYAANNQNYFWYQYQLPTLPTMPTYGYGYYPYYNPYFWGYNRNRWPNRPIHGNGGLNRPIRGGRR